MVTRILLALLVMAGVAHAQTTRLRIGIYAPSVEFDTAQERLAYVQGLAKAIEQATGIPTQGLPYASLAALKKDAPDFAIVDGLCYATNRGWGLIANARIDGSITRMWGLFASGASNMQQLRGKKLAYMQTGCNDKGFIDNAMLDSEVDDRFFGGRAAERDLKAAIAAVQSYRTAQAVFAPTSSAKGLTKLFDTGSVPNPAFVQINNKLPSSTSGKVASAVLSYGGSGKIDRWSRPSNDVFSSLASQLQPKRKAGTFATPEPARIGNQQVVNDPATIRDPELVSVRSHFVRPRGARMD